jgi:hypothetical protein
MKNRSLHRRRAKLEEKAGITAVTAPTLIFTFTDTGAAANFADIN